MSAPGDDEALFRRLYARSVAVLTRRWGMHRIEAVEDAVQSALLTAVERWPRDGRPVHPAGWVERVAHRRLIDVHRRLRRAPSDGDATAPDATEPEPLDASLRGEVGDALLRMMFVGCDPRIPLESQLVFVLKSLSGFSVPELSARLFISEDNAYKRLARARDVLKAQPAGLELGPERYGRRVDAVTMVIYLLFTEGHLASGGERAIRVELCAEALRLGALLAAHPVGDRPKVAALMALMHLHASRVGARRDGLGELVLLEAQDRTRWDASHRAEGFRWLAASARGDTFTRFHAEAGIAAAHAMAPTFAQTDWARVAACYALLERVAPSPWHRLNRALAVAEREGAQAGLALMADTNPGSRVAESSAWTAALADLHRRAGRPEFDALRHRALARAPTEAVRRALLRRWTE